MTCCTAGTAAERDDILQMLSAAYARSHGTVVVERLQLPERPGTLVCCALDRDARSAASSNLALQACWERRSSR